MKARPTSINKKALPLAISAIIAAPVVIAQEQDASKSNTWAIEEVIVTSQKRMQTLQDVPIAVSAYSGDFINSVNIKDAKQLSILTPGVTGDSEDSFLDSINIRGIVTNDFGVGAEPSVGLYQDGVYLGRTGGAVTSFYDMEVVEVVKGPQGTLFGRNSSAGAISMTTNKPTDEFSGSISAGVGDNKYETLTGIINIPLNDSFAMRAAIYHEEEDGWIKNLSGGRDYGGTNIAAGRLGFSYTGEKLSAVLAFEYEDREQDGSVYNVLNVDGEPRILGWERPSPKYGTIDSDLGSDSTDEGEVWGTTLTLEYELSDDYLFTSISAVRGHNYTYFEDFDGSGFAIDHYAQDQEQKYYSQEFHLNYDGEGAITWFVGASAYKEELQADISDSYDEDTQCDFAAAAYYATPDSAYDQDLGGCATYYSFYYYSGGTYGSPGAGYVTERRSVDAEYDGWGIYGDATWEATEDFSITVGARYTEDNRDFGLWVKEDVGLSNPSIFNGAAYTTGYVYESESWDNLSPRVAVNWNVTYDISLYANVSQGYKAGGFNSSDMGYVDGVSGFDFFLAALNGGSADATGSVVLEKFDEEKVQNIEFGIKSKWWDNRIEINASIYQYEFDDYQVNFFDAGTSAIKVVNAGDAEGKGFEADIHVLPTANLDIYFGFSILDTELTKLTDQRICDTDCVGNTLPGTVETSYALVATYTVPLEDSEIRFTFENFYQDDFSVDFDDRKGLRGDDFNKSNIRAVFAHNDGWSAELYVENVTDEQYYKGAAYSDFSIGAHQIAPAKPRFLGFNLRYEF
jgi:iron complex outermembrane receptor protein